VTLLGKAPLSVEQATEAYQGACARAAKLAAKGQRGVAEAARQLRLAGDAERDTRRVAAKTGAPAGAVTPNGKGGQLAPGSFESFAAAVQESTGATVVAGGSAGMRALSAQDRFAKAAFEAALAGVDVQGVAGAQALKAQRHREHEHRVVVVREVLREHRALPEADGLVDRLAQLLRDAELGQRIGRAR
jgi:hypothetical protein